MGMNTLSNFRWSRRAQQGLRLRLPGRPAAAGPGDPRPPRNPQAAIYWRRRAVALVIGLAVLALIAWAFSGAIGGGGAGGSQSGSSSSQSGQPGQSGQSGSAGPGQSGGTVQAGAGPTAGSQNPTDAGQTRGKGVARPRSCPHGEVVLSLFSSQNTYGAGELPQFSVDVVTTSRQTCTFNVGATHIALVIRSGSARVWSSADCVQGAGNLVSDLQRGVPTVLPISWNLDESSPGCPAASSKMPTGTYTAVVTDGALESNIVTFRVG
jgi:hypothetical protein